MQSNNQQQQNEQKKRAQKEKTSPWGKPLTLFEPKRMYKIHREKYRNTNNNNYSRKKFSFTGHKNEMSVNLRATH